ncbi:MAG TPA: fasciclin domain-containing protein [Gemmatales bacterium]|nr:fasciclin domain-containing protein [Gemmatales bacterium]HMP16354.1 fasciclin domain-containing protein [Gemmatales bacterium]
MVRRTFAALALAVAFTCTVAASRIAEETIVGTAVANKDFSTLVTAVKAAELVDVLNGDGPFTVFAPTNAAFEKLGEDTIKAVLADKAKLTGILKAHVVKGKVMASEVVKMNGEQVETLNGKFPIKVQDGKVFIGNAQVIKTDINCKNGVIHVIDTVILPRS